MDRREFFKGAAFLAALVPAYNLLGDIETPKDPKSPVLLKNIFVRNKDPHRTHLISVVANDVIVVSAGVYPNSWWMYHQAMDDDFHSLWLPRNFKVYTTSDLMEWQAIYIEGDLDNPWFGRYYCRALRFDGFDMPLHGPRGSHSYEADG